MHDSFTYLNLYKGSLAREVRLTEKRKHHSLFHVNKDVTVVWPATVVRDKSQKGVNWVRAISIWVLRVSVTAVDVIAHCMCIVLPDLRRQFHDACNLKTTFTFKAR
jgi:hypothetical protein